MNVDELLRGAPYPSVDGVPYPRADPRDFARLPGDTWTAAQVPAGVRLELVGDADAVEIAYSCATSDLGYRGAGAGTAFEVWRRGACVDRQPASLGEGIVRLALGAAGDAAVVYLPEGMRPTLRAVTAVGGSVGGAPRGPRWLAYGDSVTEGWNASGPAHSWPAVAAREHGLDMCNLGYAGAARAEIVSAEQLAKLPVDVISVAVGTNCWSRIPFSVPQFRETLRAFLDVVRTGHPETPIVVTSPVLRPDAEDCPNVLGATLADLRAVVEDVARERMDAGDPWLRLVPGGELLRPEHLVDGIHPGDHGHRLLADAVGPAVAAAVGR